MAISTTSAAEHETGITWTIAVLVTTIVAGLMGGLMTYWAWRMALGVPLKLSVPIHMSDVGSPARPWAPWWVPTGIMFIVAMLMWRLLAVRKHRLSFGGGATALTLVALMIYPVGHICLSFGAVSQYSTQPSISRIIELLPLLLIEAASGALLFLSFNAMVLIPGAVVFGLMTTGVGRFIMCVGDWVTRAKASLS